MKNKNLHKMIKVSLLGAIGFLLMFLEFAIPVFPSFLKLDISDLPALIGSFALGPVAGVAIELVKNVVHGLLMSKTAFIGELSNFIGGAILVYTAGKIYATKKTKVNAIKSLVIGVVVMSLTAGVLNYLVYLPLYEKVLGFPIPAIVGMSKAINPKITDLNTLIIWAIIPFNLLKGVFISAVTLAVYKSVSPIIHKEEINLRENKVTANELK